MGGECRQLPRPQLDDHADDAVDDRLAISHMDSSVPSARGGWTIRTALLALLVALTAGCGGSGSGNSPPAVNAGTLPLMAEQRLVGVTYP